MEDPIVKKWLAEVYVELKYSGREDIRGLVEKEGFDWKNIKLMFGSDGSEKDNDLLKKAWLKGWRPSEDIVKTVDWFKNNPELQTTTFKKQYSNYLQNKVKREVAPIDPKERKEGVKYYHDQDIADYFEEQEKDTTVTDEEQLRSNDILDILLEN
jgi:AAA+ ATPase superfamily predicted ATPase